VFVLVFGTLWLMIKLLMILLDTLLHWYYANNVMYHIKDRSIRLINFDICAGRTGRPPGIHHTQHAFISFWACPNRDPRSFSLPGRATKLSQVAFHRSRGPFFPLQPPVEGREAINEP